MLRWLKRAVCQTLFCWRRCRKRDPVKFFGTIAVVSLVLSLASFTYAFRHLVFDAFVKCSEEESLDYINQLCNLYREGQITGSLCQPLCETGQVQFSKCTNFHAGKRVNIMSCSDFCEPGQSVAAVLKASRKDITELFNDTHTVVDVEVPAGITSSTFLNRTNELIQVTLKWEFKFAPFAADADILKEMWEKDYDKYIESEHNKRTALRTIMMLIDQTEFLIGKALGSSGVVPRIYGTCGPMYLQESCPPGSLDQLPTLENRRTVPWPQKAAIVIQLLQLIERLEQDFPEVLHLCDVKGSNFGMCADGRVTVIDADNIFFKSRLLDIFASTQCKTHSDCSFFDCGGWCQTDTGQCHTAVTDNNLQNVCQDVLSNSIPEFFGWDSIFSNAPASVASKLKTAVKDCISQATDEEGSILVNKPSLFYLNRIVRLLKWSLSQDKTTS